MATSNQFRVTKDTSARKDPSSPGNLSKHHIAALKAAPEAYLVSIEATHKDEINELVTEHAAELAKLKDTYDTTFAELKQEHDNSLSKLKKTLGKEKDDRIQALTKDKNDLQTALSEASVKAEAIKEPQQEISKLKAEILRLTMTHDYDIEQMQEKIDAHPNSWIQIFFKLRGKGESERKVYVKYNDTFEDATTELDKKLKQDRSVSVDFTWNGKAIAKGHNQSLERLGIGEGAKIWFTKATTRRRSKHDS